MSNQLEKLFEDLLQQQQSSEEKLPPVHLWNPDKSGDMDLRIDREGNWIHEGDIIKRLSLVKLFSSILKREGDDYFLVTPVEKWRIEVDAAPFFFVSAHKEIRDGQQAISFETSTENKVVLSKENPLSVEYCTETGQPIPKVIVRGNLPGLLSRSVFYQLVEWAEEKTLSGREVLAVSSMGESFSLGEL